jgi:hypothetical protein
MKSTNQSRPEQQPEQQQRRLRPPLRLKPPRPTTRQSWKLLKRFQSLLKLFVATPWRFLLALAGAIAAFGAVYEYKIDMVPFPHPNAEGLHPLESFPFIVSNESKFFDMMVESFECKVGDFVNRSDTRAENGNYVIIWTGRAAVSFKVNKQKNLEISADFPNYVSLDKDIKIRAKNSRPFLCNVNQFGNLLLFKKNPDGHLEPDGTEGPRIPIAPISLNVSLIVHYYTITGLHPWHRTFQSDPYEIVYKDGKYFWSDFLPAH